MENEMGKEKNIINIYYKKNPYNIYNIILIYMFKL